MNNFRIKVSKTMTENGGEYGNEDQKIRIPSVLRSNLNISLGDRIPFDTVSNNQIILEVDEAYKPDAEDDESVCYLNKTTFDLVNLENTPKYQPKALEQITLGCDPEFFLTDKITGDILRAYLFFKKSGEIGNDGVLAELRPKPALTPLELTNNIRTLITNVRGQLQKSKHAENLDRIVLHAASSYKAYTAGFHLHFGLPKQILGRNAARLRVMKKSMRALDYYIGIPAILGEEDHDFRRRSNVFVTYGKPSDFRIDNRTLEYRVPGGSLLRHPDLTHGLLALGNVVVEDLFSKVQYLTNDFRQLCWMQRDERLQEMYPNILPTMSIYETICCPDKRRAKACLDSLYNDIIKMKLFGPNSAAINRFFAILAGEIQLTEEGMEYNWRSYVTDRVCQSPD